VNKRFSIIIPARNEEACIASTLRFAIDAVADYTGQGRNELMLSETNCEIVVVDNGSDDRTCEYVEHFADTHGVCLHRSNRLKAPCARNDGFAHSKGDILVFIDADTLVPANALRRIERHVSNGNFIAGIFAFKSIEPGIRSWLWWHFWNYVRLLPLARAKAMPAFMFCTREVFERFGPFDEEVMIGEEWPILAGLYRTAPEGLVYDRQTVALSSSRRMNMQFLGYTRTYIKYLWAILHKSGRLRYTDRLRHEKDEVA